MNGNYLTVPYQWEWNTVLGFDSFICSFNGIIKISKEMIDQSPWSAGTKHWAWKTWNDGEAVSDGERLSQLTLRIQPLNPR